MKLSPIVAASAVTLFVVVGCSGTSTTNAFQTGPATDSDAGDGGATKDAAEVPNDAALPQPDAAGNLDASAAATTCKRTVAFTGTPLPTWNCEVKQHVSRTTAVVTFPCAGGQARATFKGVQFVGTVTGTTLDLVNAGSYPWPDGCTWDFRENIHGDINGATIRYEYKDATKTPGCESERLCPASLDGTLAP